MTQTPLDVSMLEVIHSCLIAWKLSVGHDQTFKATVA